MTTTWRADPSWTGAWEIPELLKRPLTTRERGAIVALSMDGMGPKKIIDAFEGADAPNDVLGAYVDRSAGALATLERLDARSVLPCDAEYPNLLTKIVAPPPVLFVRGDRLDQLRPCVAIVGARACTSGGRSFARRLGEALASAGFIVVSGLAKGIDGAAHEGALLSGRTVAVLGTGIDVAYPRDNKELYPRIPRSGALVTEFPPGIGPRQWHFPARNRIIVGLSFAVIVVEAGERSGALITVSFAEDGGREVFACITGPENPAGFGNRALIKDGARMIVDVDQAVADLRDLAVAQELMVSREVRTGQTDRLIDLAGEERAVYESVTEGTTVEDVASLTRLGTARASAVLTALELAGYVECEFGRWRRR